MRKEGGAMRVVAWPAFANKNGNPYNYLLYSALAKLGVKVIEAKSLFRHNPFASFEVLHLHWPEYPLSQNFAKLVRGLSLVFGVIALAKLRRAKVVWTVHNLRPHEERWPMCVPWFYKALVKVVDGTIFLSHKTVDLIKEDPLLHPLLEKPWEVIPHGHYRDVYPLVPDKEKARQQLGFGSNERILLFFGQVRPYKGIEQLIEVFKQLDDANVKLFIAGKPWTSEYGESLKAKAAGDPRIHFALRHFADEEIPSLFASSDSVVLPYASILNSGSVFLALSFERPVLAPNLGSLPEIAKRVGEYWLMLYNPPLSVKHLQMRLSLPAMTTDVLEQAMAEWSWDHIARQTAHFYQRVLKTE